MRDLLNFTPQTNPFGILICYDTETSTPQFGLYYYGLGTESLDTVDVGGTIIPIIGKLNTLKFNSTRPQSGGGLIRRSIDADIKSDGPFNYGIWKKTYYTGGQNDLEFYFGLYVVDYSHFYEDITLGCFFGYFGLNAGTSWDEASGTTKISLIDSVLTFEQRPNFISDEIAEQLANTEWASLANMPIVLGNFPKYPMIGRASYTGSGYAQSSTIVKNYASGLVTADYTGSGNLKLGNSPYLSAHVGDLVKIRIESTGEIISGNIATGTGEFELSIVTRDTDFGTATLRTYKAGTVTNDPLNIDVDLNKVYLDSDDLDKIPDDHLYIKGAIDFYNGGTGNPHAAAATIRLTGIVDPVGKVFGVEDVIKSPYTTYKSGYGITFQDTTVTGIFSGAQAYLNFAKVKAATSVSLYFRNVDIALIDPTNLSQGEGWTLLATKYENGGSASDVLQQDYYVRALDSTEVIASHIFYRAGGGFVQVSPGDIISITSPCTDFGYTDLTRVRLRGLPSQNLSAYLDINGQHPAIADQFIYVDLEGLKRAPDIIRFLLTGTFLEVNGFLGTSFTCDAGYNIVSPLMGVSIADERLVDIIDKVCYESGYSLFWEGGKIQIRSTVKRRCAATVWKDGSDNFCKIIPADVIDNDIILENSVKVTVGKLLTVMDTVDDIGREYTPLYFNFSYQTSLTIDTLGTSTRRLQSVSGVKQYDRVFNYTFQYVHDKESANQAAFQFAMIGHAANTPETTRIYEMNLSYTGAKFEALDIVELKDVQNITDELDDPYDVAPDGLIYYSYTDTRQFILVPGLGVVDSISINFDLSSFVEIVVKQCQYQAAVNLTDILKSVNKIEALLPKNADIPGGATIDQPSPVNGGGRSGLCNTVSVTYPNPVPPPSGVDADPTKNPTNICCPNGDPSGGPGGLSTKYVDYCVGPVKPDLSPVTFTARITPGSIIIEPDATLIAFIKGQVNRILGDAPIYIEGVGVAIPTFAKEEGDFIDGVSVNVIYAGGFTTGSGLDEFYSSEATIASVTVSAALFTFLGPTVSEVSVNFIIHYKFASYEAGGGIVFENRTATVTLDVSLAALLDITES